MQGSEKYKIDIRPEAWAEISRIADKHLSLVGPASAKKITDQLLDDINMLATSPYMGMECPEYLLIPDHYRRLVSGVYLCFYRVIGNTVYIFHVVDGRTNYIRLFKNGLKPHTICLRGVSMPPSGFFCFRFLGAKLPPSR